MIFTDEEEKQFKEVTRIKSEYFVYELRHFFLVNKINDACRKDYKPILFFYQEEIESSNQGMVLTSLKSEDPNMMVYSFEYGLDVSVIDSLTKIYHINETPTLIIDGEKYSGFRSQEEVLELIE